jgi:hypothetical protein
MADVYRETGWALDEPWPRELGAAVAGRAMPGP